MANLQRENEIIEILKEQSYATVEYLAKVLHASPSSIRRDLTKLEQQQMVRRSHGGVSLVTAQPGMAPFKHRLHENKREKMAMARLAAGLIEPGMTIYIDSSAVASHMTNFLSADQKLTVFTNNMQMAHVLGMKHMEVYCAGGQVSEKNNVITVGPFAESMLKNVYVDMMFFASSALTEEGLITDLTFDETVVRRLMITHSAKKVFLCHFERYGKLSRYEAAHVSDVDYIITDAPLPEYFRKCFSHVQYACTNEQ